MSGTWIFLWALDGVSVVAAGVAIYSACVAASSARRVRRLQ